MQHGFHGKKIRHCWIFQRKYSRLVPSPRTAAVQRSTREWATISAVRRPSQYNKFSGTDFNQFFHGNRYRRPTDPGRRHADFNALISAGVGDVLRLCATRLASSKCPAITAARLILQVKKRSHPHRPATIDMMLFFHHHSASPRSAKSLAATIQPLPS